jgi:CRISPR-associated endonuclease Cas1 subtype II
MSWRTVVIANRAKLELKLNHLIIRSEDGLTKVFLGEISVLIIENTAVALTSALLCELVKRKIKVVFCDEKRNPCSDLIPIYGAHDASAKVKEQLEWGPLVKRSIWTEIVKDKIKQQKFVLEENECEGANLLENYLEEVQPGDPSNREGHAAKVYFNSIFGQSFNRNVENSINSALNYGYAIILSAFNREIVANGYLTQLGIFHDNMFNPFNLTSDLMEPFRPAVDRMVLQKKPETFGTNEKRWLVNVLNHEVVIDKKRQYLNNAISIYCKSVFDALNEGESDLIKFYRYEF